MRSFMNSYRGRIDIRFTPKKLQFYFAPVITGVAPNQIQKGMKIYNYDSQFAFSLDIDEASEVLFNLERFFHTGKFVRNYSDESKKPAVAVNETGIIISHFPNTENLKGVSNLFITVKDKDVYLSYRFKGQKSNQDAEFSLSLGIKLTGLYSLKKTIESWISTYVPAYQAVLDAQRTIERRNRNQNNQSNYTNSNNYMNNQSNPNTNNQNIANNSSFASQLADEIGIGDDSIPGLL